MLRWNLLFCTHWWIRPCERLAAFLNTTVAPMPTLTFRSPLEIVPRHWWRSDRGLVQQQISEWVSRKLFLFPTCWNHPAASGVVIIVHFCLIVLAAWQQQVSLLKCRMGTWRTSEKEGGQSQGISSWPTPLSDLTEHIWLSVSPPSLPSSIGSRGLNYHPTGSASQCAPLLPFPGGLQQQIAMFTLAHDAIKACYCDLWLQDRINYWLMIGNTAVRVMERIVVASFSAGCTPAGDEQKVTQWVLVHLSTTGL